MENISNAQLHSRYNPHSEAERYIDSLDIKKNIECFILIEPGLGYVIPVLQQRFNTSKIIILHVDNFPAHPGIPSLYSCQSFEIQEFLEINVPQTDVSNIRIIEWRPSLNYYKKKYIDLLSQVIEFLKRMNAGNRTTSVFGKRWVNNFFKNLFNLNSALLYKTASIPVIVTGSGPSLEKAIPFIQKNQNNCLIIAASSSVMALSHNGIKIDIIIATDGGTWALSHIYPWIRTKELSDQKNNTAFAVNLSAALPSQCKNTPFLIINDGSIWQNIVLHELSLPSVIIPQRGTVAATAIELAMILSSGSIYLAGLDFSFNDILTHVKPYSFDSLFFSRANRLAPVYNELYNRSSLLKQGESMDIYASWFKNQLELWPKRIFSISKYNKIFKDVNLSELPIIKKENNYFKPVKIKNKPLIKGIQALITALRNPQYSDKLIQELGSLLFPDEKNITEQMLENELKQIKAFHE